MHLAAEVCKPRGAGGCCVVVVLIRAGRHLMKRAFFSGLEQQVVLSPPRLLSVELAILFLLATSNAGCVTTRRCGAPACEGICVEVRSTCPPADGGLKTSGGGPERFPPLLLACYTNTLLVISVWDCTIFSSYFFFFSTHGIRARQRASGRLPAIAHLKRGNQRCPPETRGADWSQIGTRPPNQRDMLGYVVGSKAAYYGRGLTAPAERTPYRSPHRRGMVVR